MFLIKRSWRRLAELLRPRARDCAPLMIDRRSGKPTGRRGVQFGSCDHFQALREAVGDLIMEHDSSGRVLSVGCEDRRHFQIDAKNLLGTGFYRRIHVADRTQFLRALASAAEDGMTATATLRLRSGAFQRIRCRI